MTAPNPERDEHLPERLRLFATMKDEDGVLAA